MSLLDRFILVVVVFNFEPTGILFVSYWDNSWPRSL